MKLYAQIGHGMGDKVDQGLSENLISGAIFSPKDLQRSSMESRITDICKTYPEADILVDPQFYVSLYADIPTTNIGKLSEWNFFKSYRKSALELPKYIDQVLEEFFEEIIGLNVTEIISPNIYISQSLDSREGVISKNFVRQAREVFDRTGDKRPLYASLVVCREALQDRREFEEFINDITMLDNPPDGFYLVVGSRASEARSDIYHTDVLTNWMLLNLSLSVNGFRVINGYSDIVTPLLGAAGGYAGATGWYSNLRMFSMDRFFPASGGRQPIVRYLSKLLMNRITFTEKEAVSLFMPDIINGLSHDSDYAPEADRMAEALQSWEALQSLILELVVENNTLESIENCRVSIQSAQRVYCEIDSQLLVLDTKSRNDHILPMQEAIRQFQERAEL